jgi:hypothetical protein
MESKATLKGRFNDNSCKRNSKVQVSSVGDYRRSDGTGVEINQQMIIHSSMEMGMRAINYGWYFLYIKESYQQLRG